MKSYSRSVGKRNQNAFGHFAASVVTTLALALSINYANPTTVKATTAKEITPVSVQLNQTKPVIAELQSNKPQYQAMELSPIGLIPIVLVGGLVIFVPLFFGGLVVIGEREVGIVVRKFTLTGRGIPSGGLIALNGEAGLQADTLPPGWHWGYWPWQYSVRKEFDLGH